MFHREPIKPNDFSLELSYEFVHAFKGLGGSPEMLQRLAKNPLLMHRVIQCMRANGVFYRYSKEELEAAEILGHDKVLNPALTHFAWPNAPQIQNPLVPYTSDVLREFALMNNKKSDYDWRLVYLHGFPLHEQQKQHRRFSWREGLWGNNAETEWMISAAHPGYYLVNYKVMLQGGREDRSEHDDLINKFGAQFARIPINMLSEMAISEYYAFGEKYADFGFGKHWSEQRAVSGNFVTMEIKLEGHIKNRRLIINIDDEIPGKGHPYGGFHGVCIYRKPDAPLKP